MWKEGVQAYSLGMKDGDLKIDSYFTEKLICKIELALGEVYFMGVDHTNLHRM
jgi:hypothetical protein